MNSKIANRKEFSAISRDDYIMKCNDNWMALLASIDAHDEKNIQQFLETHPAMVPGAMGISGVPSHDPFPYAVISQPALPSFSWRIPDFMWITGNSEFVHPILIEIEAADKKWFNQNNTQCADFTQAHGQLAEWNTWFSANPLNKAHFHRHYDIPESFHNHRTIQPCYLLVYGRKEEANANRERAEKRASLARPNELLMTYDRIAVDANALEFMCVKKTPNEYEAITVPPTIRLNAYNAHWHSKIKKKDEAVRNSPYFTDQEREQLIEAFAYWDEEAKKAEGPHKITGNSITAL